jgi:hypothetical protein
MWTGPHTRPATLTCDEESGENKSQACSITAHGRLLFRIHCANYRRTGVPESHVEGQSPSLRESRNHNALRIHVVVRYLLLDESVDAIR